MRQTPIEEYFDAIFCLTLKRRTDRQASAAEVFRALGFGVDSVVWVYGPDRPLDHAGKPNGNQGCTEGHRMILDAIISRKIPRALIFEDDVEVAFTSPEMTEKVDPQEDFSEAADELPEDWDMLYLGGQYGSNAQYRYSPHVIRIGTMLTTSSYGITLKMARKMAPHIHGVGPIDSLYGGFHPTTRCYILQPRLFMQGKSVSDLTDREDDNRHCMLDTRHEEMLIEGKWQKSGPTGGVFDSKIYRREIAAPGDMNGTEVIVLGTLFEVESVQLPAHPAPWRRGEEATYVLKKK